jgi:hypothetical protein
VRAISDPPLCPDGLFTKIFEQGALFEELDTQYGLSSMVYSLIIMNDLSDNSVIRRLSAAAYSAGPLQRYGHAHRPAVLNRFARKSGSERNALARGP